ncbi:hypothetical protein NPIL_580371 [Nephila pilipes]|uniref:Uncharacterized protein n=1 Tax=Nephila pilipes TaxID=299642 RepID=A0A8X6QDL5_NEPPI|nr:hypothetical protein NPIL_580371 [Nephila pilipes]
MGCQPPFIHKRYPTHRAGAFARSVSTWAGSLRPDDLRDPLPENHIDTKVCGRLICMNERRQNSQPHAVQQPRPPKQKHIRPRQPVPADSCSLI